MELEDFGIFLFVVALVLLIIAGIKVALVFMGGG